MEDIVKKIQNLRERLSKLVAHKDVIALMLSEKQEEALKAKHFFESLNIVSVAEAEKFQQQKKKDLTIALSKVEETISSLEQLV